MVMLIGFVAVVTSKIISLFLVEQINMNEIKNSGASQVNFTAEPTMATPMYIGGPLERFNTTEEGWYYFYWWAKDYPQYNVTFQWIWQNMTGDPNITLFISQGLLPTTTTEIKITSTQPPKRQLVLHGCQDKLFFFGFYNPNYKPNQNFGNFNSTWLIMAEDPQFDCSSNRPITDRWVRVVLSVVASFFIMGGCVCVAYWSYDKIKHPSAEFYEILGTQKYEIENY